MTRVERRSLPGGPGPQRAVRVVRVAAAVVLAALAGLLLTALVPQALGLSAHVVMSGSMAPRVQPGDVVLTQPTTDAELRPGQVVLVADPVRPGGLLLHRLVSFDAAGKLVTRGDANRSDDSTHVGPSAVRGVAQVRIPWVGLPAVWRAQGRFGLMAAVAAVLAAAAVLVVRGGPQRHHGGPPGSSAGATPPMTGARRRAERAGRDTAVVLLPRAVHETGVVGEGRGSAPSTGWSLPPVPPPAPRPGSRPPGRPGPGGAGPGDRARPAGRGHGAAGDHSGCFDGGRLCGQPGR